MQSQLFTDAAQRRTIALMAHATILEWGTFAMAIPGAISNISDQIQKFRKRRAKKKGLMPKPTFSDSHPVWSGGLTALMIGALCVGFWLLFRPPVAPVGSDPIQSSKTIPTIPPAAQPAPSTVITADHGIAIGGDAKVDHPTVDNRQYGVVKPPPNIVGLKIETIPPPTVPIPTFSETTPEPIKQQIMSQYNSQIATLTTWKPILKLSFRIDAPFTDAKFLVRCDHPCIGQQTNFNVGDREGTGGGNLATNSSPKSVIFTSGTFTYLPKGTAVELTVRSQDTKPITATVEGYVQ